MRAPRRGRGEVYFVFAGLACPCVLCSWVTLLANAMCFLSGGVVPAGAGTLHP